MKDKNLSNSKNIMSWYEEECEAVSPELVRPRLAVNSSAANGRLVPWWVDKLAGLGSEGATPRLNLGATKLKDGAAAAAAAVLCCPKTTKQNRNWYSEIAFKYLVTEKIPVHGQLYRYIAAMTRVDLGPINCRCINTVWHYQSDYEAVRTTQKAIK